MNENDRLYQAFQKANEERKRRNFDAFMTGLNKGLVVDLDKTYASGDMVQYEKLKTNIKKQGIRIFRNSEGKHKLKFI